MDHIRLFSPDLTGAFVDRPNRFIVIVDTPKGRVEAHCPNPGRMQELLLPGTELILEKGGSRPRSTSYTLVGAIHRGRVVPLHSTRINMIAKELLLQRLFNGIRTVRPEAVFGRSRFDFYLEGEHDHALIEVKSCTLCENGVAMFPDAPSQRGVRHLKEIAQLVAQGGDKSRRVTSGHVIFVVGCDHAKVFTPNIHTDPEFALTLRKVQSVVDIKACAIRVTREGIADLSNIDLPVDLRPVELADSGGGVYLFMMRIERERTVATGSLGKVVYRPGWYVYVGSAKRGLESRINRHRMKKKTLRWHVDYLSVEASEVKAFPIYTDLDLECALAASVEFGGGKPVPRFGCSDCACGSHLFWYEDTPLHHRGFVDILFTFRHRVAIAGKLPDANFHQSH